jgi:predicted nuclease of predicted toxin-antitoxin system
VRLWSRCAAGPDVTWVRTDQPGSADRDVLARAQQEHRILLTFDKDFGELAWHELLPAKSGIVLLRFPMPVPTTVGRVIVDIMNGRADWAGHFSVIEVDRIRMRPLPSV